MSVCIHGSLARQCWQCEIVDQCVALEKENAALRAENEKLKAVVSTALWLGGARVVLSKKEICRRPELSGWKGR